MEKIIVPPNKNNDLKIRDGIKELVPDDKNPDEVITEDGKKKREKLEYFTE